MKILIGVIILVFPGLVIYGQQVRTPTPTAAPMPATKAWTEISARHDQTVKGAPFSAEGVSESVQTLPDGNRIVRKWSEKLYRSSDGKFRRESTGGNGTAFGAVVNNGSGVTIVDPAGGARWTLNTDDKTARTFTLSTQAPIIVSPQGARTVRSEDGAIILNGQGGSVASTADFDKMKAEFDAAKQGMEIAKQQAAEVKAVVAARLATTIAVPAMPGVPFGVGGQGGQKWETRTEQLGIQNFEGVDAEGTRTITTIPADAIGNERPIEIVYERWYSKELQQVVYSRHFDPRFGEQTYKLTNINRSEPDPSLFTVPHSYRILNDFQYKTSVSPRATVERVSTTKTATASRP